MLVLELSAAFAACRTFTAGWYRPMATFLTPSAAYGLALNLAGYETRLPEHDPEHPGNTPGTLTRPGLPAVRIAVGKPAAADYPGVHTVYQQLHNYLVGTSGSERAASAFGNKYNITPVRRELLINLHAVVALDGAPELENCVRLGLAGKLNAGRYGLSFVGDNAILPDVTRSLDAVPSARYPSRTGGVAGLAAPNRRAARDAATRDGGSAARSGAAGGAVWQPPAIC